MRRQRSQGAPPPPPPPQQPQEEGQLTGRNSSSSSSARRGCCTSAGDLRLAAVPRLLGLRGNPLPLELPRRAFLHTGRGGAGQEGWLDADGSSIQLACILCKERPSMHKLHSCRRAASSSSSCSRDSLCRPPQRCRVSCVCTGQAAVGRRGRVPPRCLVCSNAIECRSSCGRL